MDDISIEVHGDSDEVEREARGLRRELRELDVDSVTVDEKSVPRPESNSERRNQKGELVTYTLSVTLSSSAIFMQLGLILRDWINRKSGRKLTVRDGDRSIEIVGPLDADATRVIDTFFRRPSD